MITIRVPGTTANLGPGFDSLGLALGVYGYFTFEETDSGLEFENVAPEFQNEENLAIRGYRRAIQEMGLEQPGIYLHIESDIPVSSGLGSSASLIVAGVVAANEIHGKMLNQQTLIITFYGRAILPAVWNCCRSDLYLTVRISEGDIVILTVRVVIYSGGRWFGNISGS